MATKTLPRPAASAEDRPAVLPLLLTQPQACRYVGLPKSEWYRMKAAGELPDPVFIATSRRPRYRRADLDRWVKKLKANSRTTRTTR